MKIIMLADSAAHPLKKRSHLALQLLVEVMKKLVALEVRQFRMPELWILQMSVMEIK
jgi:hypothetical protein